MDRGNQAPLCRKLQLAGGGGRERARGEQRKKEKIIV